MNHFVQLAAAVLTFVMSFMAVVSPIPKGGAFSVYHKALHTLAWGTFLLTIDFGMQFHWGWRFTGSELGPIFNLIFFTPASILYILSLIMLQNEGHVTHRGHIISVTGLFAVLILTVIPPIVIPDNHLLVVSLRHLAALTMVTTPTVLSIRFARIHKTSKEHMRSYANETTETIDRWLRTANRMGLAMILFVPVLMFGSPLFALISCFVLVFGLLYFFIGFFTFGFSAQWYLDLLRTAIEEAKGRKENNPALPDSIKLKFDQWVAEKRYLQPHVTIETLAHDIAYNRSSLSLYFNQSEGVPFRDWINSHRLDESCHMLEHTSYNINEIADKCGFSSAKYFGTIFRDRYGVSPSEWRHNKR